MLLKLAMSKSHYHWIHQVSSELRALQTKKKNKNETQKNIDENQEMSGRHNAECGFDGDHATRKPSGMTHLRKGARIVMVTGRVARAAAVHTADGADGALSGTQRVGAAAALRAGTATRGLRVQINAGLSVMDKLLGGLGQNTRLLGY